MTTGRHDRVDATCRTMRPNDKGGRVIRHGGIGRFDANGTLILPDRGKEFVSGGFNVYPIDPAAVPRRYPAVADRTVVGMPSAERGEMPIGFYASGAGAIARAEAIQPLFDVQLGRTQRPAQLDWIDAPPPNAMGEVLKRERRERLLGPVA